MLNPDKQIEMIRSRSLETHSIDEALTETLYGSALAGEFAARKAKLNSIPSRIEDGRRIFLTPVVDVKRLTELEGESFVAAAYEQIFGRQADPLGLSHYTENLTQGLGKMEIILALARSEEGKRHGARLGGYPEVSLFELLQHSEEDFLDNAYLMLLGREIDPSGKESYLRALRYGTLEPVEILHELCSSPEGSARGVSVPGLEEAYRKKQRIRRLCALPLIGRLFRFVSTLHRVSRQVDAVTNRLEEQRSSMAAAEERRGLAENELWTGMTRLSEDIEALSVRLDSHDDTLCELSREGVVLREKLQEEETRLASLSGQLDRFDDSFSELSRTLHEQEVLLIRQQENAERQESTLSELRDSLAGQEKTVECVQSSLSEHQSALIEHQGAIERQQSALTEHQGSLSEQQGAIERAQSSLSEHQGAIERQQSALVEHQSSLEALGQDLRALHGFTDQIGRNVGEINTALSNYDTLINRFGRDDHQTVQLLLSEVCSLRAALHDGSVPNRSAELPADAEAVSAGGSDAYAEIDYFDFENRFRGSREHVKEVQRIYLPYFEGRKNVLDLGCGRCEFTELLTEQGVGVTGVDLYAPYVEYGKMRGLPVVRDDALHYLRQQKSTDGIFLGQVAEHLSLAQLTELCALAYEKLESGSVLIVETPNPTSLAIFTESFYIDPSHQRPVHPRTLEYLAEKAGFSSVELLFTESSRLPFRIPPLPAEDGDTEQFNQAMERVNELLYGSQDYALIARK